MDMYKSIRRKIQFEHYSPLRVGISHMCNSISTTIEDTIYIYIYVPPQVEFLSKSE